MSLAHRCMIIPAALQAQCQSIPEASEMWTTGLSLDGAEPATHYISSGLVDQSFADLLTSPEALSAGSSIPLGEAEYILSVSCIIDGDPHLAMGELGLKLISPDSD